MKNVLTFIFFALLLGACNVVSQTPAQDITPTLELSNTPTLDIATSTPTTKISLTPTSTSTIRCNRHSKAHWNIKTHLYIYPNPNHHTHALSSGIV
jgi:uncharacterized protein YcfL